jgi:antitoxin ParD1/3/4
LRTGVSEPRRKAEPARTGLKRRPATWYIGGSSPGYRIRISGTGRENGGSARNVSLPDPLYAAAEDLADRGGFKTVDEYLADLIRRDLERRQQQAPDFHLRRAMAGGGGPASVTPEALEARKREIEALLIEGLESGPATPQTAEDWVALRERVEARLDPRNGGPGGWLAGEARLE